MAENKTVNPTIKPPKKPELYSRDQLVKAMVEYNKQYLDTPEEFDQSPIDSTVECAEEQIDYLLGKVEQV